MATTFQKRQKEMKRAEKQREKAERRAQRKLAKNTEGGESGAPIDYEYRTSIEDPVIPNESEPQS
jgi:hypothetical protein